ncbi:MAG: PP2C family protein-serine/threonine phosphatase, partial [Bacteroidota bacterium]
GDCTGHGVPGAFISLIAIMLIQEIVFTRKIHAPGEILNCLHQSIKKTLCQEEKRDNNGMDAIVCRVKIQEEKAKIHYASAKRPLYFKSPSDQNMQKIKGTRKSIGGLQNESIRFETQELELGKGSMVYLFTDGLVDQNNALRKKLGEPQLLLQLNQIFAQKAPEQKHQLDELLDQHMSETTQRDDITGLGFRV